MILRKLLKENEKINQSSSKNDILKLKDLLIRAGIDTFCNKDFIVKKTGGIYYLINSFIVGNEKTNCEFYIDKYNNQIEIVFKFLPNQDSEYTKTFTNTKNVEDIISNWFFDKLNDYLEASVALKHCFKRL
jgi:hypothetical protein